MATTKEDIGRRIKRVREKLGLKQHEFAEKTGVGSKSISSYETGATDTSPSFLEAVARLGNVTIDWLITGSDTVTNSDISTSANESDRPIAVSVNGGSAHIAVHHGPTVQEEASPYDTSVDAVDLAFVRDWKSLSDVTRMRIWTIVKEEIERKAQG